MVTPVPPSQKPMARARGEQQSAQGGSLHTPTTDHSTQLITAHAHDHHSSYSSRARVAIAMRLMFSGGIVKPPGFRCVHWRCLWTQPGAPGGSAILGKSLPELIQGLHRPTRSLADWFLRVSLRAHVARVSSRIPARRRVAAWSDPAPTAFAWALDTSAGSPSAAASTRAQQSRGHLDPLDYLREVTQHRGVLV